MELVTQLKKELEIILPTAKKVWVATAMVNHAGWELFKGLKSDVIQHHIIGVDLPTPPNVLSSMLDATNDNLIVKIHHKPLVTFHPKVYIIEDQYEGKIAYVGSSNATHGGLNRNTEMNVKIVDSETCNDLLSWFAEIEKDSILLSSSCIENYKKKFENIRSITEEVEKQDIEFKNTFLRDNSFYFDVNDHAVLSSQYQMIKGEISDRRKKIWVKLKKLSDLLYPEFHTRGLNNLHQNTQNPVSTYTPIPRGRKKIDSLWLQFGKAKQELKLYSGKESKFSNHVRMQVIILERSVGTWLIIGKRGGSLADRNHLKMNFQEHSFRKEFFDYFKKLDGQYWIRTNGKDVLNSDIQNASQLNDIVQESKIEEYFIIGRDFDVNDERLKAANIKETVLGEFKMLYPLYELTRHRPGIEKVKLE